MATDAQAKKYNAPALERGLDILELLATKAHGISQKQIGDELGKSAAEIFRMLLCLERRGYVSRSEIDDLYRLTPLMLELAHRHPPTQMLHEYAGPVMRDLSEQLGESCHLVIRHEEHALVIAQTDGPGFIGFAVRVGTRVPLFTTASGHVLAAFASNDTRTQLIADVSNRSALIQRLQRIVNRGYEQMPSQYVPGIEDLSCPVMNHDHSIVAALTVPYHGRRRGALPISKVRQALQHAAARLSKMLGASATQDE